MLPLGFTSLLFFFLQNIFNGQILFQFIFIQIVKKLWIFIFLSICVKYYFYFIFSNDYIIYTFFLFVCLCLLLRHLIASFSFIDYRASASSSSSASTMGVCVCVCIKCLYTTNTPVSLRGNDLFWFVIVGVSFAPFGAFYSADSLYFIYKRFSLSARCTFYTNTADNKHVWVRVSYESVYYTHTHKICVWYTWRWFFFLPLLNLYIHQMHSYILYGI